MSWTPHNKVLTGPTSKNRMGAIQAIGGEMVKGQDVVGLKLRAEALVKQTANELRAILQEMVGQVDFPMFPGTPFQCVEADPGLAQGPEFGCIVVCPDGELRELTVQVETPGMDIGTVRREDLRDISIPPEDYIVYAYNAIQVLSRIAAGERIY